MEEIYSRYQDRVEFFVIYVQEAHPTDGWQIHGNVAEGCCSGNIRALKNEKR